MGFRVYKASGGTEKLFLSLLKTLFIQQIYNRTFFLLTVTYCGMFFYSRSICAFLLGLDIVRIGVPAAITVRDIIYYLVPMAQWYLSDMIFWPFSSHLNKCHFYFEYLSTGWEHQIQA